MLCNRKRTSFTKNVSFMFLVYWAILVGWQNISRTEARTDIDIIIKIGLLAYFVLFFIGHTNMLSKKVILVLLFSLFLMVTIIFEQISLGIIISYIYPVVFMCMVYGLGDNFTINKEQLVGFCLGVVWIVLYTAVYALIFCTEQFKNAFLLSSAYGNELSSFFISSHEYGMYLLGGIISSIICLKYTKNKQTKVFYIISIIVFVPNIILTFSRTSIIALLFFVVTYMFLGKDKLKKWLWIIAVLIAATLIVSPKIFEFTVAIVLKDGNMSGRDKLFSGAVAYFKNGNFINQLFGFGITNTRHFFELELGHGSVHNAYLQVLLYYGIIGLAAMIIFLLVQIYVCIKTMKKNLFMGVISFGLLLSAILMMFTNTSILFTSPIDSFFLTIYFIVIPKYVRNAIKENSF